MKHYVVGKGKSLKGRGFRYGATKGGGAEQASDTGTNARRGETLVSLTFKNDTLYELYKIELKRIP